MRVPQADATWTATVDRVESGLGSSRSYTGRFEDESRHSFVMTLGRRHTFGHLTTPRGSYELTGNDKFAWLMSTAGMDRHVDYTKSDFVVRRSEEIP